METVIRQDAEQGAGNELVMISVASFTYKRLSEFQQVKAIGDEIFYARVHQVNHFIIPKRHHGGIFNDEPVHLAVKVITEGIGFGHQGLFV
jgi:hypothetical protein